MEISVKDNVNEFIKRLDSVQRRQIPFATSQAINDTAVKGQEAVVKGIKIRFNSRKKWWVKGNRKTGIRVNFSSKKKIPMVASVYTNAYFAKIQEEGGIKKATSGTSLAIPTTKAPKSLKRSDGVKRALSKSNVYVSQKGVFRRMAKGKVKPLFTWAKVANIKPAFKFEITMRTAVNRWMPINFRKRLKKALATAKL